MSDLIRYLRNRRIMMDEEAADRIEALEAALWDIMMDVEVTPSIRELARAAIMSEQHK